MGLLSGIGAVVGGLSGLFSKSKGAPSARENTVKLAQGARQASELYGFNPLTMLQYGAGAGGGGGGGGAPPLASVQILVDGLQGVDDALSGRDQRQKAAEELEIDLARLRLEQMRSGVFVAPASAAGGVMSRPSPLGRQAGMVLQNGSVSLPPARAPLSSASDSDHNPNKDHPLRPSLGNIKQPDQTIDRGAGYYLGGYRIEPAPGWSSGESYEQEYGDGPVAWAGGVGKLLADIAHNAGRAVDYLEAKALKKAGVSVHKVGGKYYADEASVKKANEAMKNQQRAKAARAMTTDRAFGLPGMVARVAGPYIKFH